AGQPGQLAQIDSIDLGLRRISLLTAPAPLSATADGVTPALHPKLRRWDQADGATADGVAIGTGWIALEDGVEVQFSGSGVTTGDTSAIPASAAPRAGHCPPLPVTPPRP